MIETARLVLRGWRAEDAGFHRALVTHPLVVRTLGGPPPPDESMAVIDRQSRWLQATGSCFWVVALRATGAAIGWCGIKPGPAGTPIAGKPEAGWTIHPDDWGEGYAREAARAVVAHHWTTTAHPDLWAITTPGNIASRGLMERLGMTRVPDADFNHPNLPDGDPLRRHLTYVIARPG